MKPAYLPFFGFIRQMDVNRLTQEWIIKALINLGFDQCDAEVYVFLSEKGSQRGKIIAASLSFPTWKIYRSLRRLKKTGIVTSSVHRPAVFSSVAYDKVMDQFIEVKKEQVQTLLKNREQLLSNWRGKMKSSSDG